jgi:hypothetical protein
MGRIFDEITRQHSNGLAHEEAVTSAILAVAQKLKKSFPVTFTIEDACLTNCDAIWLAKHCYL